MKIVKPKPPPPNISFRFVVGYRVVEMDKVNHGSGAALEAVLFDYEEMIDCKLYHLPTNMKSDAAIMRWVQAREYEYEQELMECLFGPEERDFDFRLKWTDMSNDPH